MIATHSATDVALRPARAPQPGFQPERMLVIDPLTRRFGDYRVSELPQLLRSRDHLVVNDAATLPASLRAERDLELRLLGADADGCFRAVALGAGDFRLPTEARPRPRALAVGESLSFGPDLKASVTEVDLVSPRLVRLRFSTSGAAFWQALYRRAQPIQYSYSSRAYELWDVQNRYAARPWAFELPSAGHPLTFQTIFEVEARGATLSALTHAASLSSTGDAELDARLPLAERFDIPLATAQAIQRARAAGGRIVAVGTSVVRALEASCDPTGAVRSGVGETTLRLSATHAPASVDGLLTGLHEPGTSHFELMEAFAPRALLGRAVEHAERTGYLQHEFGDSCLILSGALLPWSEA